MGEECCSKWSTTIYLAKEVLMFKDDTVLLCSDLFFRGAGSKQFPEQHSRVCRLKTSERVQSISLQHDKCQDDFVGSEIRVSF